ncbi:D-alanyl-D-alanine carboxypeptidase [Chlamydia muridarum str. Nigg]|uniref:D-alanyl-D-alanine carboxypeptidase n=2 Tax=Chlamydia muridarum TaxID=83560 RepID=A0A070A0D2_CHLMR|nr:D-alanyl-D-alanine carboxypeptidase family protein [Chlamydia muridarum]AAF39639.1 D-alanyl-D-alanine carboxypeptidase, putative [Chlamydia muridarum str. Nigg]AHH23226.1 D-alanyl-D-alanine carboxypeptidase [Chlamydia muridarum str. Nigg3 CMUT3-5]AHH24152.1 D-alanyl-D-alanine carboxypeptidase [Chlamydia muridarum str. Nigg CM972]AID38352.1 D-alanyl-D-alanine carboxypeptidase [Chlamydia muridarum str. Nigg 2 MCR]AIT90988.1 D-alanyl-D-alanine carboxypeptidase [Chlamydia muridarum]
MRILSLLCRFFICSSPLFLQPASLLAASPAITTKGLAAAVMHADSGAILKEKNLDQKIFPASMTKIATALLILRKHPDVLTRFITIRREPLTSITPQAKQQSGYRSPPHWLETDGVAIQLKSKEEVSGWDLFHALLISSANDAANVLADACCQSVPAFMHQLNDFLKEIGCQNTHFNSPHGLHHPDHYTTARDLAIIMKEALKEPLFCQVIRTASYTMESTNLSPERTLSSTNRLLSSSSTYFYPPCLGGKTGTTKSAGKNIVFAAEKNNRSIIVVAAGYFGPAAQLYQDAIAVCEDLFNEQLLRCFLLPPASQYSVKTKFGPITAPVSQGIYYDFYPSEGDPLLSLSLESSKIAFPIRQGDLLGHWILSSPSGEKVHSIPFLAESDILPSFKQRILLTSLRILTSYRTYVLILLFFLLNRKKKHSRATKTFSNPFFS